MSRDILKRLDDATIVALQADGADWPRSLLGQTPIPDKWMGLAIGTDGRRRFVPAGEDPQPARDDTLVLVRNRAITVPLTLHDVPTKSPHVVDVEAELLLRCPAREDDLAALHRTLLTEDALTLEQLANAVFTGDGEAAVREYAGHRTAEALLDEDQRNALCAHLADALKRSLLASGLELDRLGRVTFISRTLQRQRALQRSTAQRVQELEARASLEQAARAATARRLEGLEDILGKLRSAAGDDARVKWHALLPSLTPGERGRLLESLWRIMPNRCVAHAIVAVAGRECVWLNPQRPDPIHHRVTLPNDLGGLRSISFDAEGNTLLVGAAEGVWRLGCEEGDIRASYRVPVDDRPRTGFNAAVVHAGHLVATHSQLGAWRWPVDSPDNVTPLLQPAAGVPKTIRAVTVADDKTIVLAADDCVHGFGVDGIEQWRTNSAGATIHCLAVTSAALYVGTAARTLLRCDLPQPGAWTTVHQAHTVIESMHARRWDDLVELVIPAGDAGVAAVYSGEGIEVNVLHTPVAIRRAWACDDVLVGLTEARDRLVVATSNDRDTPCVTIPLARKLTHSIQDVCLIVRPETASEGVCV